MNPSAFFALGLSSLGVASVHAWEHVSGEELKSTIEANDVAVVAFANVSILYQDRALLARNPPLDEKSKYLEPEWESAAPEAQVPFVSIDCAASPGVCESYAVSASSTVKLFLRGEMMATYNGPWRGSAIVAWINRMRRPAVTEVASGSLGAFKQADETVFLAYISADDGAARTAFATVAAEYRDEFTFGTTTDVAALVSEKVTPPTVKCYKPLDGDIVDFDRFSEAGALETFVKEASRPTIGELLPHNHQRFLDRGWPMVYLFATTEAERAGIRRSLNGMARRYRDSLTVVTVDPLEFPELPASLGLLLEPGVDVFPAGAVHQLSTDRVYPYPRGRGMSPAELQGWGLDVWQGRVRPWTPPGDVAATTAGEGLGWGGGGSGGGRVEATRRVSVRRNIPGVNVNVRVGGRDEL